MLIESPAAWIFCALQLTLLGLIVLGVIGFLIRRRPDLACSVATLTLLTGLAIVLLTATGLPRPWTLAESAEVETYAALPSVVKSQVDSGMVAPQPNSDVALLADGVSLRRLWQAIRSVVPDKNVSIQQSAWSWPALIVAFACVVCFALLLRMVIGSLALVHLRITSHEAGDKKWDGLVCSFAQRIDLAGKIVLRSSSLLDSPCVTWLAPRTVFVPRSFESWSPAEQESSLAHELAHIKRRDALWRFLTEIAWTAVCWHPLMWLIRRQMTLAQELSADRMAVIALGENGEKNTFYRNGLSALALRLDAMSDPHFRSVFFLSTSINSSSLIRRIKMLKGFQNIPPAGSVKGKVVTSLTLCACVWLCCWSADAQTQQLEAENAVQTADDGIRVAAVPEVGSEATGYTFPISKPWEELGGQPGYVSVRVSELLRHQVWGPRLPELWDSIPLLKKGSSFSDFGLSIGVFTRAEFTLDLFLNRAIDDRTESGLSIGGGGFSLHTSEAIEWSRLIDSLDVSSVLNDRVAETFMKSLRESTQDGTSVHIPAFVSMNLEQDDALPTEIQLQMWDRVGGGVITALIKPAEYKAELLVQFREQEESENEELTAARATVEALHSVAVGVEISDSPNYEKIRMAFEPADGFTSEELKSRLEDVIEDLVAKLKESDLDGIEHRLGRQLNLMRLEVVSEGEHSFVMLEGDFSLLVVIGGL